jgi:proteasome lid subunit RPN8/RPN11
MDDETQPWQVKGYPIRVSCDGAAMESMRQEAMAGLQKIPRRGLEIGGILFGRRDGDTIEIQQWREIACSHSHGPGFDLSEDDEQQLQDLFDHAGEEPELARLEVVGWFRTRTKGDVFLSDADLAFYDRFFPESWQIVLVIRPHMYEPSRAGYFFRESGGVVRSQSSHNEFELENRRRRLPLSFDPAQGPRRPRPPEPTSAGEPPASAAPPPAESAPPSARPSSQLRLGFDPANPALGMDRPLPAEQPRAARGDFSASSARMEPAPRRRGPRLSPLSKIALTAATVLVVLCAIILGVPAIQGAREATLNLDVRDVSGQLVIDWNKYADVMESVSAGTMRIVDGANEQVFDLSIDELHGGTLVYQRQTGDVELHLTITGADGSSASEIARFVGASPAGLPGVPAAPTESNPVLAGEAERIRAELEEARKESDRVQTLVDREKRRLGVGTP